MVMQAEEVQQLVERVSWTGNFPMLRGGVATFSLKPDQPFCISVRPCPTFSSAGACEDADWVGVVVDEESAHVFTSQKGACQVVQDAAVPPAEAKSTGYKAGRWLSYWVSFDPDGCKIKYGIGHHMEETTMLEHSLNLGSEAMALFRTAPKVVSLHGYSAGPIERRSVFEAKLLTLNGHEGATVQFARCPLIANPPPLVVDSSRLTLLELGRRSRLPSSDLPPACQVLYQHLSQPCIDLDWSPDGVPCPLTAAIRHSLATPGALLHTRCQEKAARCPVGAPAKQSYLRVSVGVPSGCSPGIPYVLEIWPPGHFSPVHNHGNAFGIVRILHGSITARTYNKHLTGEGPLQEAALSKGDITWFSPNWYQTHQLENHTGDFCCTVQGFQYAADDDLHWPYMQFKGPSGSLLDFLPVSDFSFGQMRESLLAEYAAATAAAAGSAGCRGVQQQAAIGVAPADQAPAAAPEQVTGADALAPRCRGGNRGRVIDITAAATSLPASCRRALRRQMTPNSPLEAAAALAALHVPANDSAGDSPLAANPPRDVITLL